MLNIAHTCSWSAPSLLVTHAPWRSGDVITLICSADSPHSAPHRRSLRWHTVQHCQLHRRFSPFQILFTGYITARQFLAKMFSTSSCKNYSNWWRNEHIIGHSRETTSFPCLHSQRRPRVFAVIVWRCWRPLGHSPRLLSSVLQRLRTYNFVILCTVCQSVGGLNFVFFGWVLLSAEPSTSPGHTGHMCSADNSDDCHWLLLDADRRPRGNYTKWLPIIYSVEKKSKHQQSTNLIFANCTQISPIKSSVLRKSDFEDSGNFCWHPLPGYTCWPSVSPAGLCREIAKWKVCYQNAICFITYLEIIR